MINKFRIDWHEGMRLTDEIFRLSDEYHISRLQPLYSVLVNGDYGFINLPLFRYELNDNLLSITELHADAVTFSGKLIRICFNKEERDLFKDIKLPDASDPLILYIDNASNKTVKVSCDNDSVPLCDDDYQIIVKPESQHYNNPDAVPFARLIHNYGWSQDSSFVAPCVSMRSNVALLRSSSEFIVELDALIQSLKNAVNTAERDFVISVLPELLSISMEVKKAVDAMSPRYFIMTMQKIISLFLLFAEINAHIVIPERDRCREYVESTYTPYILGDMLREGIFLTHLMITVPSHFSEPIIARPVREEPVTAPQPRRMVTDSIRRKHH